jgi:hypothetical protein
MMVRRLAYEASDNGLLSPDLAVFWIILLSHLYHSFFKGGSMKGYDNSGSPSARIELFVDGGRGQI